ncbi:unnamed protein product [Microthlaspi erraticum]|uniref:Ku C-terminal domain-containing protein n=1 Tax=Microthlaspi erraticum TaxID=1685480 RepID=A0A6D2HJ99_9BRAS|nr:unnamed protein product [Microthlaspi erraticum]CAA7051474.1 unnamed protein product [Microthlaspi erraticum]
MKLKKVAEERLPTLKMYSDKAQSLPNTNFSDSLRRQTYCELKSRSADAALPPVDEVFKKIMEQDQELTCNNKSIMDAVRGSFEVKENPKLKKSCKRYLRDKPSVSDDEDNRMITYNADENKVDTVGEANPIQDFEAMISRRDHSDWIDKAISCVLEQEPKQFNEFLNHLYELCQERNLSHFLRHFTLKKITLIPKSEAADSDVADEDAGDFAVKQEPKLES